MDPFEIESIHFCIVLYMVQKISLGYYLIKQGQTDRGALEDQCFIFHSKLES